MNTPKNRAELRGLIARQCFDVSANVDPYETADAILTALEAAGVACVPVRATNTMIGGVEKECHVGMGLSVPVWLAMLAASPYRKETE